MGRVIEGRWDCVYCGTRGIRGGQYDCPNCGKTRGADTKFYIGDPHDYVSKPVSKEPDWLCLHCDSYNSAEKKVCKNCGYPRGWENPTYYEVRKSEDPYYTPETTAYTRNPESVPEERIIVAEPPAPLKKHKFSIIENFSKFIHPEDEYREQNKREFHPLANIPTRPIAIFAGIVAIIVLLVFLFTPRNVKFEITQFSWKYEIVIQELRTFNESDWHIPAGGRLKYTRSEIHYYEQVLDHYETRTRQVSEQVLVGYDTVVTGHRDIGNGYFEEITSQVPRYETQYRTETYQEPVYVSVPVYDTKYYYEIDRWTYNRSVVTDGTDRKPYYGEVVLGQRERESGRHEIYTMTGIVEDEEYSLNVDYDTWMRYHIGSTIKAKKNRLGIIYLSEDE